MAFRWRASDGPALNSGLVALCNLDHYIAKKPYLFLIFYLSVKNTVNSKYFSGILFSRTALNDFFATLKFVTEA